MEKAETGRSGLIENKVGFSEEINHQRIDQNKVRRRHNLHTQIACRLPDIDGLANGNDRVVFKGRELGGDGRQVAKFEEKYALGQIPQLNLRR